MFHIGIAPPAIPRREKRDTIYNVAVGPPKFTGRPTSWLLLPKTNLSFFQRQLDIVTTDSFNEPYDVSNSFDIVFSLNSIAYGMATAMFPTKLTHKQICSSVKETYTKNMKIRWAMKKVLNKWRTKHITVANEDDIATQESPKKKIVFIDWKTRVCHQFEAATILRDTMNRLFNHDQLFLQSLPPRNPFTNSSLSYGALVSLHNQLRRVGVTHWLWEAFAASDFDIESLEKSYEMPMKMHCLDVMMRDKTNFNTIDFVMDFIIGEYTHHVLYGPPKETVVLRVLSTKWDEPKVQDWVKLCKIYWTNEIRGRCDDNSIVHMRSETLIRCMRGWHLI